jgi:hypothetical protein
VIVWEKGRDMGGSGDDAGVLKGGDSAEQHPSEEGGVEVVDLCLQERVSVSMWGLAQ